MTTKWILAAAIGLAFISGCAPSDSDKIADAQDCLDHATSDNALTCMDKVSGLSTASAELIRCSAYLVDQGFSEPARLLDVVQQIKDNGNRDSATISALSFMAFRASKYSKTENNTYAGLAFTSCQNSLSSGLIYLMSMSRIATEAMTLIDSYDPTSGNPPSASDIQTVICDPARSSTTSAVIGSAAQIAYEKNCVGKDITADPVCQQYAAAVSSGTTPEQIGDGLATAICH